MSNDARFNFALPRSLKKAIEEAAHEERVDQAQLVREVLRENLQESEAVPPHLRLEMKRDKSKARNRLRWQRIHFPSNVAERFRRAFEQGDFDADLNPGAVDEMLEIYRDDVERLFGEEAREVFGDDPERYEAAMSFVEALGEKARDAEDASEFDALDPEEMFEHYTGVNMGRQREKAEDLVEEARERLSGTTATDADAVARSLANTHDVEEDLAVEAVEEAERQLADDDNRGGRR